MEPVQVILNPASGGGEGARLLHEVEAGLRRRHIPYRLRVTSAPGDAREFARTAEVRASDRLLVVGGDGTVHETVNGLLGEDPAEAERLPAIAVLPVGTGNDFYRMVGAPRTLEGAMDMLQWGVPSPFDVGRAEWEEGRLWFVNLLGVGIDVEVLRQRERVPRLKGMAQYMAALLRSLVSFRPVPLRIELGDGERFDGPVTLAGITVGPSAAGGFLLNPGATPDDGLLDLCRVEGLTLLQTLRYIPKVIRGTHAGLAVVALRRFARALLTPGEGGKALALQTDGELIRGEIRSLEVSIRAGAIRVLIPAMER